MLELLEAKQYFHRPTILPSPSFLFHHLPSIFFQFLPFSSHKKKIIDISHMLETGKYERSNGE